MNKAASTHQENLLMDSVKDIFPNDEQKNIDKSIIMTPQRNNETFYKQILDSRMSKTDDGKKNNSYNTMSMLINFPYENNFMIKSSQYPQKQNIQNKYTGCNCRKSQCLKMYCTCFAVGKMCDETCLCDSCKNDQDNMDRSEAINQIIEKDPFAFSKKNQSTSTNILLLDSDACNCRKSNCTKKYCDCYRKGKSCGPKCHCIDCNNCSTTNQDLQKCSNQEPKKKIKKL